MSTCVTRSRNGSRSSVEDRLDGRGGNGPQTPPSSFVFTSSRIGKSHRNPDNQDDLRTMTTVFARSRSQTVNSSSPTPVLSAVHVTTHAYGAAHALPAHSSFRRNRNDGRPGPMRSITSFPTPPRCINPSSIQPRPQASKSFYLGLIGRLAEATPPSDDDASPVAWSPISEPAPKKMNTFFPPSSKNTLPNSSSPITPRNDNQQQQQGSSYFTFKPRQPSTSHHR